MGVRGIRPQAETPHGADAVIEGCIHKALVNVATVHEAGIVSPALHGL
jgi:hypothetical protein